MNRELTAASLLHDIKQGALTLNQVPCTICRKNPPLPRTHFHGSDWGRCIRSIYFECMTGRKPVENGEDAMRLNDGHFHEAMLVKSITLSGHTISHRDTIDGEIMIAEKVFPDSGQPNLSIAYLTVGHTDGVIDGKAILECKAVKDWAWKNKFMKGLIPKQYYGQVQFYLHAHGMQTGFLAVKNRHTSEVHVFTIERDQEYIEKRRLELAAVFTAITKARVIAIPKKEEDDECRFCDFYNHCWTKNGV